MCSISLKVAPIEKVQAGVFSDREHEILDLICQGMTTQEIGELLHISQETVKSHRKNMIAKGRARNMCHLIYLVVANSDFQSSRHGLEAY